MPRRPLPTIGIVKCAHCGEIAAVRKGAGEQLYYVCGCGGPYRAHAYVEQHATMFGADGSMPDNTPEWIQRGLAFKPGTRAPESRPRAAAPAAASAPDPDPSAPASSGSTQAPAAAPVANSRWGFGLFR
jgi:hypothetical protein